MAKHWLIFTIALTLLGAAGCSGPNRCPPPGEPVLDIGCVESCSPMTLDRGTWKVSRRTAVWKVQESQVNAPPKTIGYLVRRKYREMRGGPEYHMYMVTTTNRREEIGRIDQMGRAWRYEPRRNAGFEEIDEGTHALEIGVAAIFQTRRAVTLHETTERVLAFELLDRDGSGYLEKNEVAQHGDRLQGADRNGDGLVGFDEFDALDVL
jgi:hypothetical protein